MDNSVKRKVYSREELFSLKRSKSGGHHPIPAEMKRCFRGCRAGVKVKAWKWRYKPFLPSVIMGNVNSLPNKSDELEILVKTHKVYSECSLVFLRKRGWIKTSQTLNVDLPGFTLIRSDRDSKASGKKKGGGLALFVNQRWCSPAHIIVKEKMCCPDIELLAVGMRPYYVPREFSHIPEKIKPLICCIPISKKLTEPLPYHHWAGQITTWFFCRHVTNPMCGGSLQLYSQSGNGHQRLGYWGSKKLLWMHRLGCAAGNRGEHHGHW